MTEPASSATPPPAGQPKRDGEGMLLGAAVIAAYVGFGAFAMLHDGGRPGSAAHAGVSLDAVRAVSDRAAGGQVRPPVGVGETIPDPGVRSAAGVGVQTGEPEARLQFLVKLEDGSAWRDRFLENPAAARAAWTEFTQSHPEFAGLRLERMSYSGEATLELESAAPESAAAQQALSSEIVGRLRGAEGVEYAEPNLIGGRERPQ